MKASNNKGKPPEAYEMVITAARLQILTKCSDSDDAATSGTQGTVVPLLLLQLIGLIFSNLDLKSLNFYYLFVSLFFADTKNVD